MSNLKALLQALSPVRAAPLRVAPLALAKASGLRGGTQPAEQLLRQLAGKPGVTKGTLQQLFGHLDPRAKMSPEEFAGSAAAPKLMAQRGFTREEYAHPEERAEDLVFCRAPEALPYIREAALKKLEDMWLRLPDNLADEVTYYKHLIQQVPEGDTDGLHNALASFEDWTNDDRLGDIGDAAFMDINDIAAREMAYELPETMVRTLQDKHWQRYQRQPSVLSADPNAEGYFETVLRAPPSRLTGDTNSDGMQLWSGYRGDSSTPDNYHFSNRGQLGHVRGTALEGLGGERPSVFLEELQSDPLEALGQGAHPEFNNIYGLLGRMVIDRAAEGGAGRVWFPGGARIGDVRPPKYQSFYNDVYDRQLDKQLFGPLASQGLKPVASDGWTYFDLPEDLRTMLERDPLGYSAGGLAHGA